MAIKIDSKIRIKDILGAIAVRLGFRRQRYVVEPGLYEMNEPDALSPVFVSANYKLSFDHLRSALGTISCRILVLDTKGINVWCAAGKGTFGTDELIRRIDLTGLKNVINHKRIILPQLGGPGVQAHIVRRKSGLNPVYGPVEARDIPLFIEGGYKKTENMRTKTFTIAERLVLTPLEIIHSWKLLLPIAVVNLLFVFFSSGLESLKFSTVLLPAILGVLAGGFFSPLLLPWIPFRAFALKGAAAGLVAACIWFLLIQPASSNLIFSGGLMISMSSFITMNFTGASTYTSLSGVRKEMRIAVPAQIIFALVSIAAGVLIQVLGGRA